MHLSGVADAVSTLSTTIQAVAAALFIWEWYSKSKGSKTQMALGKKLFTVILILATFVTAGFAGWLYGHPLESTPATVPCSSITGAATTHGGQSPANTGNNNTTTYGQSSQPQKTPPK
jgi:hypothetical protein